MFDVIQVATVDTASNTSMRRSALQAQLSEISLKSTNSLDLKTQRRLHAKSLLYGPKEAAVQDFDWLFETCCGGFRRLCQHDSRFEKYAANLFSGESKTIDRTQMTLSENKELDILIEEFLSLISGIISTQDAALSIEWLVRRFQVHDRNLQAVVLAFLPYYDLPVFLTLLSIIPDLPLEELPELQPFKKGNENPTIHSIITSAIRKPRFLAGLNRHVLNACGRAHDYPLLIEFWKKVTTAAIDGQLNQCHSRTLQAREQKEEDVTRRICNVLFDEPGRVGQKRAMGTAMREGCLEIITTLSQRTHLSGKLMRAITEEIGRDVKSLSLRDLACLSSFTKERRLSALPRTVTRQLLNDSDLVDKLRTLVDDQDLQSLLFALVAGFLGDAGHSQEAKQVKKIHSVIDSGLIDQENVRVISTAIKMQMDQIFPTDAKSVGVSEALHDMSRRLVESRSPGGQIVDKINMGVAGRSAHDASINDDGAKSGAVFDSQSRFEELVSDLPQLSSDAGLLKQQSAPVFARILGVCAIAGSSTDRWARIENRVFPENTEGDRQLLLLTLFIRVWCTPTSLSARLKSLLRIREILKDRASKLHEDQQFVLPYIMVGLADSSYQLREATASLLVVISEKYTLETTSAIILGPNGDLYATSRESNGEMLLSTAEAMKIISLITESLEECRSDASYIGKMIRAMFKRGQSDLKILGELEDGTRGSMLSMLARHIVSTPLLHVQISLMRILRDIGKVNKISKTDLLRPLILKVCRADRESLELWCKMEDIPLTSYIEEVISSIAATNQEGLNIIRSCFDESNERASAVRTAAANYIVNNWSAMRPKHQQRIVETLYYSSWRQTPHVNSQDFTHLAVDVLRSISLSSMTLLQLLECLPPLAEESDGSEVVEKRRRTENGYVDGRIGALSRSISRILQQWEFVLELVSSATAHVDFYLIDKLCQLLNDAYCSAERIGERINTVMSLLLECCDGVVKDVSQTKIQINPNIFPVEIVINIFLTRPETQIQRSALRLISDLAESFPDATVSHVMPVFTKMGESLLRSTDQYSVNLTNTALDSIIPPLLKFLNKQKGGSQEGMARLLSSFVLAFEQMPSERRTPIFISLVKHLGPTNTLHLLVLMCARPFAHQKSVEGFVIELFGRHTAIEQMDAIQNVVRLAMDGIGEYPTPLIVQILSVDQAEARAKAVLDALSLASQILEYTGIAHKAVEEFRIHKDTLRSRYSQLLEEIFKFSIMIRRQRSFSTVYKSLLKSTLRLLPVDEVLSGLQHLLSSTDDRIVNQALKSIEERIRVAKTGDVSAQRASLNLLSPLTRLLESKHDSQLVQTCISCLDSAIDRFGHGNASQCLRVISLVASPTFLWSDDSRKVEISMMCTVTIAQKLGEAVLPALPNINGTVLGVIERGISSEDANSLNAAYAFFATVLDSCPVALSRHQTELLLKLSARVAVDEALSKQTIESRKATLGLIARRTESNVCISVLSSTWADVIQASIPNKDERNGSKTGLADGAILQHIHMISTIVNTSRKSAARRHARGLTDLFIQILELSSHTTRSQSDQSASRFTNISDITRIASEQMVNFVRKLNDVVFRPLLKSMFEWANRDKDGSTLMLRHFSLYIFLSHFFKALGNTVTTLSETMVEDAANALHGRIAFASHNDEERRFERNLWSLILEALRYAFDGDVDDYFQAPHRFEALSAALVHCLASPMKSGPSAILQDREKFENHLILTILSLARAADADGNAKLLNKNILKEIRSPEAQVRITAIRCQRSLVERLREQWISNLSEMLPIIAEALEHEDLETAEEARRWVRQIEEVRGESLNEMLR